MPLVCLLPAVALPRPLPPFWRSPTEAPPARPAAFEPGAQRDLDWPCLRQRDAAEALHDLLWRALQAGVGLRLGLHGGARSLQVDCELRRLCADGGRLRLEAPGLQWQIDEAAIAELRCLRLSTAGGVRHRIEALDASGQCLLDLQAQTAPGRREPCAWRLLVDSVGRDAMEPERPQ
ncbi:MAG: hypothetical protein LCI02_20125 [Proteobacteria bacterium]|nr:hypothetical protein [Pseudomonadota bacterium]